MQSYSGIMTPYTICYKSGYLLPCYGAEAKFLVPNWGINSTPWHSVQVNSGIVFPMVHVLKSTLKSIPMRGYSQLRHIGMIGEGKCCGNIYGNQELHLQSG
jgi:hypothetical protein